MDIRDCKCGQKPCVKRNWKFHKRYMDDDYTKIYCKNPDCDQKAVVSFVGYEKAVSEWNRSV